MKESDKDLLRGMELCIKELETAFANLPDIIGTDSWIMHNLLMDIPTDAVYEYVEGDPENLPVPHKYIDILEYTLKEWFVSFKEQMEEEIEGDDE